MASASERYDQLIEDLRSEYRPQREWAEGRGFFLIVGHFAVGVAAGAWLFGLFYDNLDCMIAAYVVGALGGLAHLVNLGRPERFLRMTTQVRTSWVARGFWGLTFFLAGGFVVLLPALLPGPVWSAQSAIAGAGHVLAVAGVAILIGYMGFVYTASKAIPFWNSPLHPALYIAYAFRGGAAALMLALAFRGLDPAPGLLEIWIGVTAVVVVLWLLELQAALSGGDDTARRSVHDLLAGRLAVSFYGGTLVVGLVVPALLVAGFAADVSPGVLAVIGLASVAGDFFIKFSSIKAGVYMPLRPRQPAHKA